jgi:glutathione S-transferase
MLTLYGNLESGNVYKVRQLLAQLGIAHRRVDVAQFPGEPRTAKFPAQPDRQGSDSSFRRRACALGIRRDPVLPRQWYIVPAERILGHGECAALDVFRAYSHEPYVAVNGYILRRAPEEERARLIGRVPDNHERGQHALSVMEQHLRANDWFVLTATRSPI